MPNNFSVFFLNYDTLDNYLAVYKSCSFVELRHTMVSVRVKLMFFYLVVIVFTFLWVIN